MANVDLLHIKTKAVDPETGLLTRPFFRWLTQLYERTGGTTDAIEGTETALTELNVTDPRIDEVFRQLQAFQIEDEYQRMQSIQDDRQYAFLLS